MLLADTRLHVRDGHAPRSPYAAFARERSASLIRIGSVVFPCQAALARQALGKIGRSWSGEADAYLVDGRDRAPRPLPRLDGCRVLAAEAFAPLLDRYLRAGRVFVPTASEASGELALYALASGVPLDALCFDRVPPPVGGDAADATPLHGDLFLKVAAAAA